MARGKCPPCPPCDGAASAAKLPDLSVVTGPAGEVNEAHEKKGFVFPQYGFYRKTTKKPCVLDEGRKFVPGRIDLEIFSDTTATAEGVKPGPTLRFCTAPNAKGPVVSVDTPMQAVELVKEYQKCVNDGEGTEACAVKLSEKTTGGVKLAGARRRSSRKAARR